MPKLDVIWIEFVCGEQRFRYGVETVEQAAAMLAWVTQQLGPEAFLKIFSAIAPEFIDQASYVVRSCLGVLL